MNMDWVLQVEEVVDEGDREEEEEGGGREEQGGGRGRGKRRKSSRRREEKGLDVGLTSQSMQVSGNSFYQKAQAMVGGGHSRRPPQPEPGKFLPPPSALPDY